MTSPEDRELEDFLARRSRVTAAWRELPGEEPPPALDARVRALAAAELRPQERERAAPLRWLRPAALAATLVLSISLVLRLDREAEPPAERLASGPVDVRVIPPQTAALPSAEPAAAPPAGVAVTGMRREERRQDMPLAVTEFDAEMDESRVLEKPALPPLPAQVATAAGATAPALALDEDALGEIVAAIRARLGPAGATGLFAREKAATAERAAADAGPTAAEERLHAILALHDAGRADEATAALAAFARDFPGDRITSLIESLAE
jgi:hypothetical protein